MTIQWYPGHMAKARREVTEKLKYIDVVIELLDARAPLSSRNPVIDELAEGKPRLILLNKTDLADPAVTKAWTSFLRKMEPLLSLLTHKMGKVRNELKRLVRNLPSHCL